MNDLEAKQPLFYTIGKHGGRNLPNYPVYPRASIFYGNAIGVKVAERAINVRLNKQALSD